MVSRAELLAQVTRELSPEEPKSNISPELKELLKNVATYLEQGREPPFQKKRFTTTDFSKSDIPLPQIFQR